MPLGGHMINVNCIWNDKDLCKNKKIKRSLFGFGARLCIEYRGSERCELKQPYIKPKGPPPPPRLTHKTVIIKR
jgi:hypothetical protein